MAPKRQSELLVCQLLACEFPDAEIVDTDHNVGHAVHDLEIRRPGAPTIAVEVTEDRSEASAAFESEGEPLLTLPNCHGGWSVALDAHPTATRRFALDVLDPFLAVLEAAGAEQATIYPDTPFVAQIPHELRALGFVAATRDANVPPRSVRLQVAHWSSDLNPDLLATWVTDFTNSDRCTGERTKLHATSLDDRHLAIVLPFKPSSGWDIGVLMRSLDDVGVPLRAPALPPEITQVWLVHDYPDSHCLSWSSADGWVLRQKLRRSGERGSSLDPGSPPLPRRWWRRCRLHERLARWAGRLPGLHKGG